MNNFKIVYCFCCCFFFEALSSNELRAYNELFTKIQTLNSILTMSTSMSIIIDNQNKTTTFAEALRLKTTRNTFTVNVLWLALVFQHISFSQYVELNWSVIDDHESIWLSIYLFEYRWRSGGEECWKSQILPIYSNLAITWKFCRVLWNWKFSLICQHLSTILSSTEYF